MSHLSSLFRTSRAAASTRMSAFMQAERASAASRRALADPYNATVSQLLRGRCRNFAAVQESMPVMDAVRTMNKRNVGSLVVFADTDHQSRSTAVKSEPLKGIITERDVLLACPRLVDRPSEQLCVKDIMSRDLSTVDATATVGESMAIMIGRHIRHLPVVDRGELVGVLSIRDLVEKITRDHELEVTNLNLQLGRLASVLGDHLDSDKASEEKKKVID